MKDKVVTFRLSEDDYKALTVLAKKLYPTCSVSKVILMLLKPYINQIKG